MLKRIFSLLLCMVLCLSIFPVGGFAAEDAAQEETVTELSSEESPEEIVEEIIEQSEETPAEKIEPEELKKEIAEEIIEQSEEQKEESETLELPGEQEDLQEAPSAEVALALKEETVPAGAKSVTVICSVLPEGASFTLAKDGGEAVPLTEENEDYTVEGEEYTFKVETGSYVLAVVVASEELAKLEFNVTAAEEETGEKQSAEQPEVDPAVAEILERIAALPSVEDFPDMTKEALQAVLDETFAIFDLADTLTAEQQEMIDFSALTAMYAVYDYIDSAQEANDAVPEGATRLGETGTWYKLEDSDTRLIIGGTGDMPDFISASRQPWYDGKSDILSVVINSGVTHIGQSAFNGFFNLNEVTIQASVTSIGSNAFQSCNSVTGLYIDSVESWCGVSLAGSGSHPLNGTATGKTLYVANEPETELVIPYGVTMIPAYAFYGCAGLTSVTIPEDVWVIGKYAFCNCAGLTDVTIPAGVWKIEDFAFSGCSNLTSVRIPAGVESIGSNAFQSCYSVTHLYIDSIERWCNVSLAGSSSHPLSASGTAGKLFVNNVETTELVIPDFVSAIPAYAFYNCAGLTSVTIPEKVSDIGTYAFYNCTGFTSVTIPAGVKNIGRNAFYGCGQLASVTVEATEPPTLDRYVFTECSDSLVIFVPAEAVDAYKAAARWSDLADKIRTDASSGVQPHNVTVQVHGSHGTATLKIGDAEATEASQAEKDTKVVFTAAPENGYTFDYWEVVSGGIKLSDTNTDPLYKGNNPLIVTMPDRALTLRAYFKKNPPAPEPYSKVFASVQNSHAVITSATAVTLKQDDCYTFTAKVTDAGYYIGRVYVDGVNVGAPYQSGNLYSYTYRNTDVTKNHTVTFAVYSSMGAPATGDDSSSGFWTGLFALSGLLALGAVSVLRKSHRSLTSGVLKETLDYVDEYFATLE